MKNAKPLPGQTSLLAIEPRHSSWVPSEPPSLDGISEIQLDTETTGLDMFALSNPDRPIGIALGLPEGRTVYLPWGHAGGNLPEDAVKRWAKRELRGKHIVNFNTRFDAHMLHLWGVDLEEQGCTVSDVGHWDALLDDHRLPSRCKLEDIAQDHLGEGKVVGLDKKRMAQYHAGDVAEYAKQDVRLVQKLQAKLYPLLVKEDLLRVKELEDKVIYPVCAMERAGAFVDEELLTTWLRETEQRHLRLLWEIADELGFQVSPSQPSDLERVFHKLKLPIVNFTETGKPSFDDAVLHNYSNPVIQKIRETKKIESLRVKFLVPYGEQVRKYGRVRYGLHQMRGEGGGTISGRFSSSNVNVQQVMTPKKQAESFGFVRWTIRELFRTEDPRHVWLAADAKQIEYRLFAHYSKAPKVLEAYRKDPETDFHALVRTMIVDAGTNVTRKKAKDVNFAFIYGAGPNKIAEMLAMTRSESDALCAVYRGTFPEADRLLHDASRLASSRGYVYTLEGRRARFPDKKFLHAALNRVIQGSAADINKRKIVEVHEARKETGFILRLTVHDEQDGDSPSPECTRKVTEILNRQSYDLQVPILWDVGTGHNWKEAKDDTA